MSRILRGLPTDASTIHSLMSDDGIHEVSGADLSLSDAAAAFTSASTVEQWLIAMQTQVNAFTGTTPVLVPQLASLWTHRDPQQDRSTQPVWFAPEFVSFIKV